MDMYLSGNFYAKKINSLKILKNAKTVSKIVLLALKGYFCNMSICGLLLVNWHDQIYPGKQNAKEIPL